MLPIPELCPQTQNPAHESKGQSINQRGKDQNGSARDGLRKPRVAKAEEEDSFTDAQKISYHGGHQGKRFGK